MTPLSVTNLWSCTHDHSLEGVGRLPALIIPRVVACAEASIIALPVFRQRTQDVNYFGHNCGAPGTPKEAEAEIELREKAHLAPYIARKTWFHIMEKLGGTIANRRMKLWGYRSAGSNRMPEVAETNSLSEQILGDNDWGNHLCY